MQNFSVWQDLIVLIGEGMEFQRNQKYRELERSRE